jgi:hypothetical protein
MWLPLSTNFCRWTVKNRGKVVPVHAIKSFIRGSGVVFLPLFEFRSRWRCAVSLAPTAKSPRHPLNRKLAGRKSWFGYIWYVCSCRRTNQDSLIFQHLSYISYFHTGPSCISFTPTLISRQYFHFVQLESLLTFAEPGWRSRYSDYATAWAVRYSIPGRDRRFFSSHPTSFSMGTTVFFSGVNWPGREVNHSSLPSADVKNEWSFTSTPPTCLLGVDRENFKFLVTDSPRRNVRGENWEEKRERCVCILRTGWYQFSSFL